VVTCANFLNIEFFPRLLV